MLQLDKPRLMKHNQLVRFETSKACNSTFIERFSDSALGCRQVQFNMKKQPLRISYKNEHGAKMFTVRTQDDVPDDKYIIKTYGGANKWPDIEDAIGKYVLEGTDAFLEKTKTGRGMCYVICNTDSYNKLKARYQ